MHQHRLVLNGPPTAVQRLADDLRAAGAVAVADVTAGSRRLVWATAGPTALEGLCADHRSVVVGVERFELLGDELQRLVVRGREATLLERRTLVADDGDAAALEHGGLCLDEDGAPLAPAALRTAARRVLTAPAKGAPGPGGSAVDDAVLMGAAAGRLCVAAGDPSAGLGAGGLDAVAALAAAALTVGGAGSCGPSAGSSARGA
jgi:hypothetical protein